jgi:hypothetical protein
VDWLKVDAPNSLAQTSSASTLNGYFSDRIRDLLQSISMSYEKNVVVRPQVSRLAEIRCIGFAPKTL